MANETLGTITCPDCGGLADVAQTKRGKGRYLYTRCPSCGPDQRAGAAVQTRLWLETDWRDGKKPLNPPPNAKLEAKPEPKQPESDFDPITEMQPIADQKAEGGAKFLKVGAALMGFGLVALAAFKGV